MNRSDLPTPNDLRYMSQAIQLAKKGRFTTTPNPNVGCVIVKNNIIIGQGWHQKAGTEHAEVHALKGLSLEQSKGATAYVTLEPCSHFGRTPPCAEALIKANIARVVIAMQDPNPQVAGNGVRLLNSAGIQTVVGVLESEARALNPGFLKQMEHKKPFVQLKLASSLDGKTALHNGQSKWITDSAARADVQTYRAMSCAIISSAKSVIADNAKLNVRANDLNFDYPFNGNVRQVRQPVKIILDGSNNLTTSNARELELFKDQDARIIIAKTPEHAEEADNAFDEFANVEIAAIDYQNGQFDLAQLLNACHGWQLNRVWVEAGAKLSASFVEQNLVDQLIVYIAPKLMGKNAIDLMPVGPFEKMTQAIELNLQDYRIIGNDIKLTYSFI